ncbi:unnamed protein product [Rotaria sp. Silwood1]|nr:unnamed protein product [Rotaria sp. Silwood1]CAF1067782.1 unnamed protein product [Rotaria sp. Silwood1]CAF3432097.1 unnamed protein product [Rotaria sp. Silwood1]CAF3433759.1 unnamed protein product [Rotaria sp. Silwood1]CAF4581880.1 unnamed protein product [Rotaria sp. Silwood1]
MSVYKISNVKSCLYTIKIDDFLTATDHNKAFVIESLLDLSHSLRLSLKLAYLFSDIVYSSFTLRKKASCLEQLSITGCTISLLLLINLIINTFNLYSFQMKIYRDISSPDFSIFQQITTAILKFVGFSNDNFQNSFSSMACLISLHLDDETSISTARLFVSNTVHIAKASAEYFNLQ